MPRTIRHRAVSVVALASTAALLTTAAPALAAPKADDGTDFVLAVLHNNDGESALLPFEASDGASYGGAARFVSLLDELRHDATSGKPSVKGAKRGAVVLNSGDNYLAGTAFQASRVDGAPFYDALVANAADYDVLGVGNHEFDFGPDVFGEFVRAVDDAPFVSANLDFGANAGLAELVGDRLVASTVVKERGEKIGVVGLTTPALATISSPIDVGVDPDVVAVAQEQVDALTADGIDKIILASHLQDIGEELDLVAQLSDVDVVIGGGGDEILADDGDALLPGDDANVYGSYPLVATDADGSEVPVVTTPGAYRYVGQIQVSFDRNGDVIGWDDDASGLQVVTDTGPDAVEPDPTVLRTVEEPVAEFQADLAANVLAESEVALECRRDQVRTGESNCGNLMADSLLDAAADQASAYGLPQPDVAVQNGGGIRIDAELPAGPVTEADTFGIAPFSNFVAIAPDVPAETFRQLLEEGSASLPGSDGAFVHAAGFSYTVDTSYPARVVVTDTGEQVTAGERVRSVVLDDGTVLVADGVAVAGATVNVASNDFSLAGGDAYPAVPFTRVGVSYQQALAGYLVEDLGGVVSAADYPVGGSGRITIG
ncbi:multifunctional 2',3'-cyclic-nucleotide 2'-phosphodiesterase/5'-nucleotidase/3'-nucleotidase [Paraoerskovia sediminicola]|uniref:Multifunctional 2',3'-cyclic-nucleotide 2'-phosphodiesterase/5'-nucleotidase/3'-nucleotidase n=1 Tax=Paraoerskovia sediminicola TaxID=1138587 RepID=A0ABN6XCL8_9CELL|nr:bifunctional metallophosphatase/5'-nucleotidase [Paraoerskovia sediminicola]BDZ41853.1 multifunctional 2',3'-cyclic-nucleotide 2'-phosphodiesterase/5'-nucleotidase/3'-nucleotidase [Paraoerskovia sediminicola]